jgi:regulator of protease activity HflC (stomatin/prohibitin superfamily)
METNKKEVKEIVAPSINGMVILIFNSLLILIALIAFILVFTPLAANLSLTTIIIVAIVSGLHSFIIGPILFIGLKALKPNEALVLTLFGNYYGTLKTEGLHFVNPFAFGFNPTVKNEPLIATTAAKSTKTLNSGDININIQSKKISLKAITLNNEKQKVNDSLGNPVIIGIVVIWRVINSAKAVFNIDNYFEYLSIQSDAALRNIARLYPYDTQDDEQEKSLRGSSIEVANKLKEEIQQKCEIAGLEIIEARITHLSYAPEIASVMLQRQQATAIIAARQKIVEGAVGMVEMALEQLNDKGVVELDEERKAAMVSNLLVVLCGNRDAQPVVNSGTIY